MTVEGVVYEISTPIRSHVNKKYEKSNFEQWRDMLRYGG